MNNSGEPIEMTSDIGDVTITGQPMSDDELRGIMADLGEVLGGQPQGHQLVRTSPKGEDFIGRCIACGREGLGINPHAGPECLPGK